MAKSVLFSHTNFTRPVIIFSNTVKFLNDVSFTDDGGIELMGKVKKIDIGRK